jgi:hypothetical protein
VSDLPTYSFLPWLRSGVANSITQADGDPGVTVRASMPLDVTLTGTRLDGSADSQVVHRNVSLYGPGDIIGIDSKAIVKVDPRNWITNFESNYLPYVDFYDEDFPWRYTPAAADGGRHRLRPWIALVVLADSEFTDGKNVQGKPLPYFDLATGANAATLFPAPSELWAWAHVHVNLDLSNNGDESMPAVLQKLQQTIAANPDLAYSRLLCPRALEPDKGYHAFIVPSFESGRLAGLGLDVPDATVATASAWDNHQTQFPYYYRWYFKTGDFGDFEYLVNLLKPRPVDKSVGVRDMDVLHPGSNLPAIATPPDLQGILKLGGALRVPFATLPPEDQAEVTKFDQWDVPYPHPFESAMAARINLADDYARQVPSAVNPDGDPDPVVTSPLYGQWHALTNRVLHAADGSDLPDNQNWVHRLNLDPRFRVSAGFGTRVVQNNDEQYMNAAWQQVGDVLTANQRLRLAQLAQAALIAWYGRHLTPLALDRAFVLTQPLHARVVLSGSTVHEQVRTSAVPRVVLSPPFRKVTRQGTPLTKRLGLPATAAADIVTRINKGELYPAPPKVAPPGAVSIGDAVNTVGGDKGSPNPCVDFDSWEKWLKKTFPWLARTPEAVWKQLREQLKSAPWLCQIGKSVAEEQQTPKSVDQLPKVPNFTITRPGSDFTPVAGAADSVEGAHFKDGLRDVYRITSIPFLPPVLQPIDLPKLATGTLAAIDPVRTVPKRLLQYIFLPPWLLENLVETFTPAMAYPVLDVPMYKPLSAISSELFLPNINKIPPNSMTLLESNQRFIEAYMVGLNHEMARELLWREYPTDQRGSYFRQFWDVSLQLPAQPTAADRERLRDIPELHRWSKHSALGTHNYREQNGAAALLVLVIRGELLKRYPTAVIYAQHASWGRNSGGNLDVNAERQLDELTAAEENAPPQSKIRMPLFEAKIDPDIYFIGFDLTAAVAKGGATLADDPGWFFVIKERPGEPRFGADDVPPGQPHPLINWDDLSWSRIGTQPGTNIRLDRTLGFDPPDPGHPEHQPDPDDAQAGWSPNTNSADLAYILYRVPVLVAAHASRMLP